MKLSTGFRCASWSVMLVADIEEKPTHLLKMILKLGVCLISLTDVLFDRAKCFLIKKVITTKI